MRGTKRKRIKQKVKRYSDEIRNDLVERIYQLPLKYRLKYAWKVIKGKKCRRANGDN